MEDEFEPLIQRCDEKLAAPSDVGYDSPDESFGAPELVRNGRMRIGPHRGGAPAGQLGIELSTDRLDLGKLGHGVRLFLVTTERLRAPAPLPRKPDVGAGAFGVLDLRAGRVLSADSFPEARQPAYKLRLDFGEPVGVLHSSAQVTNYRPEELVGRMVVGAINLGSKRIAGFQSECLVLGTIDPDGTVRLLCVEEGVAPGAPIA
jgi:tRNA-binding protein